MNKNLNLLFIILLVINTSSVAKLRTITSEDFYSIKLISDCQVSPNGKTIVYVVEQIDRENNRYISNLWSSPADDGPSKQLTTSQAKDTSPRWSPDSKYIAFVSNRSGINQIWIISIDGGEAWSLTDMPSGAFSPSWSPDATRIAFLSRVNNEENNQQKKKLRFIIREGKEYATDIKLVKNLKYRYDTEYFDEKYTHIFIISINGGKVTQLTSGNYHDSAPIWSPDSKLIAFSSNRAGDFHFDDNSDIYVVPSKGGPVNQITSGPGPEYNPIWSPDGKYISYLMRTEPNNYAQNNELCIFNYCTKQITLLTTDFDRSPFNVQWSFDNKTIYFLAADHGNIHLFSNSLRRQSERIIGGKRQLQSFQISSNKKIIFIASKNTNPSDLYLTNLSGSRERQLTKINQEFLGNVYLCEPEEIYFTGFDNTQIHGWIMKPIEFSLDKKYPLIVEIHGGPHWFYGNCWFQEFQVLAAQGYVIFYCNPRLSTGYGQQFATSGIGQWGKGDYQDIMVGINYVINLGYVDSSKIGITGGSYGGYMTNWIISHTNKFKAAVTQRSLSNLVSFYGTTDIQGFIEFEFGLDFNKLYSHSPLTYAKNIRTPLLILHSELDYRVPISQAEELFTILKRLNREVKFVRYPDEGHELSRSGQPVHRVDRYNRIIDWFNKYLK